MTPRFGAEAEAVLDARRHLMVRRQGPQLRSLIYDKASEADHVMRPEAADSHQGQGRTNVPLQAG